MNYFELYDIPVSFQVDPAFLKRKYHELSQRHSDFFEDDTKEEHPSISRIAKAFKILQDQDETIKYVLELKGLLIEDEKYQFDPQFLLELIDINEELVELELDEKQEQLMNVEQKANRLLLKIYEDVAPIIEYHKEDTVTEEELLQVKDFYFQKKYLQRILDRIRGIRNIASPS